MAVFKISFMTLAFLIVAGFLISGNNVVSDQVVSDQVCKGDFGNLEKKCLPYVQKLGPKIPPSKGCCKAIKTVDIPCACHHLPPGFGDIVSLKKVAYVLRACGKPLAPGTKCGNYTVPPPAV